MRFSTIRSPLTFWLLDLDVDAVAGGLVVGEPVVVGPGRPVHGALDQAEVGLAVLARPGALPPVRQVVVHL